MVSKCGKAKKVKEGEPTGLPQIIKTEVGALNSNSATAPEEFDLPF